MASPGGAEPDQALLDLAREIQAQVAHVGDQNGGGDALVEAIEAIPRRERLKIARQVFGHLPAEQQWAVLERAFAEDELRTALEEERRNRLEESRRRSAARRLIGADEGPGRVDMTEIEPGASVSVGLFGERDVTEALDRGHISASCARRVDLRHNGNGTCRVLNDVFNPLGGFFVTRAYDETVWRSERLPAHSLVRLGSLTTGKSAGSFEPVIYAGGRVDFEIDGNFVEGRLHAGYLLVADVDLFIERGKL